jgi:hypothetical protein
MTAVAGRTCRGNLRVIDAREGVSTFYVAGGRQALVDVVRLGLQVVENSTGPGSRRGATMVNFLMGDVRSSCALPLVCDEALMSVDFSLGTVSYRGASWTLGQMTGTGWEAREPTRTP